MTRTAADDGWGALGAGRISDDAGNYYRPLDPDALNDALPIDRPLLWAGEHELARMACILAWQRAAHDAVWRDSKSAPGQSKETIRKLDVLLRECRFREAREILANLNEMTALHIEVRSAWRVSFGVMGKRAAAFTMLDLLTVRSAVKSLVANPPKEFQNLKSGAPAKLFARDFRRRLVANFVQCLGVARSGWLAERVYRRLSKRVELEFVVRPRRDLDRPERGRKPAPRGDTPAGMRRHKPR